MTSFTGERCKFEFRISGEYRHEPVSMMSGFFFFFKTDIRPEIFEEKNVNNVSEI